MATSITIVWLMVSPKIGRIFFTFVWWKLNVYFNWSFDFNICNSKYLRRILAEFFCTKWTVQLIHLPHFLMIETISIHCLYVCFCVAAYKLLSRVNEREQSLSSLRAPIRFLCISTLLFVYLLVLNLHILIETLLYARVRLCISLKLTKGAAICFINFPQYH